jgi:hypothetical protein
MWAMIEKLRMRRIAWLWASLTGAVYPDGP